MKIDKIIFGQLFFQNFFLDQVIPHVETILFSHIDAPFFLNFRQGSLFRQTIVREGGVQKKYFPLKLHSNLMYEYGTCYLMPKLNEVRQH